MRNSLRTDITEISGKNSLKNCLQKGANLLTFDEKYICLAFIVAS